MDLSFVTTFDGSRGLNEDSSEFVEELELAAHTHQESYRLQFDKFRIFAFRSKLIPGKPAAVWYATLPPASKCNWNTVKSAFLERFQPVARGTERMEAVLVDLLKFCRNPNESANDYIQRASDMSLRTPETLLPVLKSRFLSGLNDPDWSRMMSVALEGRFDGLSLDETFAKLRLIAYPFGEGESSSDDPILHTPTPRDPSLQLATVLENLDKTLRSLEIGGSKGRTSSTNYSQRIPDVPKNPFEADRPARSRSVPLTCFGCGQLGHREDECQNPPLPYEERSAIRRKVMDEIERRRGGGHQMTQRPRLIASSAQEDREGNCIEVEGVGYWNPEAYVGEKRGHESQDDEVERPLPKAHRTQKSPGRHQSHMASANASQSAAAGGQPEPMQTEPTPTASGIPKPRGKVGLPPPPIRLQASGTPYNVLDILRSVPAQITMAQLLDVAPRVRQEVSRGLVSSRPRKPRWQI